MPAPYDSIDTCPDPQLNLDRRSFVGRILGAGAAASVGGIASPSTVRSATKVTGRTGGLTGKQRQERAFQIRQSAALSHHKQALPRKAGNGDEELPRYFACFSKTLPHDGLGEVNSAAYEAYLNALSSGMSAKFEAIPMGSTGKLSNPQASYAFGMEGPDAHEVALGPPPSFSSAALAAEMVENYWLALTRDVPFGEYGNSQLIHQAITDLSRLPAYAGPSVYRSVWPNIVFRGTTPGDLVGPFISQFLLLPIPYGMTTVEQRYRTAAPGIDFMTSYQDWIVNQRGFPPTQQVTFDPTPRYIRNGRDLSSYVHSDFSYQAVLNAALILLAFGAPALSNANPYKAYKNQSSFVTFGAPNVLDLIGRVSGAALKATWYHKWLVHRRIRPEEFGGRIHNLVTNAAQYPVHGSATNSAALQAIYSRYGTYLLPQAYPEGCPNHPSFPAGHAALVGAGVTVLKAFFQTSATIPNPVEVTADGLGLAPYTVAPLTIGGELDKLANNISLGRDTAGLHYRSDGVAGLQAGEAVAVGVLQDLVSCYSEEFDGFTITRFDGRELTICPSCTT